MPNHFVEHLKGTVTVKFSKQFQKLMSFSSEPFLDLASSRGGALLPVSSLLSQHRMIAWKLAGVGDELVEVRHPVSDGSSALCGCQRGAALDGAVQRRPSHQRPPRGHPLTCACCRSVVVDWKARSALPAAAVPVRPFRR